MSSPLQLEGMRWDIIGNMLEKAGWLLKKCLILLLQPPYESVNTDVIIPILLIRKQRIKHCRPNSIVELIKLCS